MGSGKSESESSNKIDVVAASKNETPRASKNAQVPAPVTKKP